MLIIITIFAIILNSGNLMVNLVKIPIKNNAIKVVEPKIIMPIIDKKGDEKLPAIAMAPYSMPQGIKPNIIPKKYP